MNINLKNSPFLAEFEESYVDYLNSEISILGTSSEKLFNLKRNATLKLVSVKFDIRGEINGGFFSLSESSLIFE